MAHNFNILIRSHCFHQLPLRPKGRCCQRKKSKIKTKTPLKIHSTITAYHQTDRSSNQLVKMVKHLSADPPNIFFRSLWRPKAGRILDIHLSCGQKFISKWMLMSLCFCSMDARNGLLTCRPQKFYKVIICQCLFSVYSLLLIPFVAKKKTKL